MLDLVKDMLVDSDSASAIEFLEQQGDPLDVADTYASLVKFYFNEAKDLARTVLLARAGIQYGLARAAALEGPDREMAYQLRSRAKAMAYNLASFTWPGWDEPEIELGATDIAVGLDAARTNLRLARELDKGNLALSRAHWIVGAHLLAARQLESARQRFALVGEHAAAAGQEAERLMAGGYGLVALLVERPDDGQLRVSLLELQQGLRQFEHGDFFAEQLETAVRVFVRGQD